jgi:uncharacterized protein (DUF1330 family)
MAVYMIFIRESPIRDQEAMQKYSSMNRAGPRNPHMKPLVVYGTMKTIEGKSADGIIVLEFPSEDDAMAWYNSPEYQAAIPYRMKGADYRAFLVHGK